MRLRRLLASIALPLALPTLAACAAAPAASAPAKTSARALPAKAAAPAAPQASALPAAPSLEPTQDLEAQLIARIDELGGELELAQRSGGPRRLQIAPTSVQLADLPVGHVEPPLSVNDRPTVALLKTQLASELVIRPGEFDGYQRTATVNFKEPTFGVVVVGDYQIKRMSLNQPPSSPGYMSCGLNVSPRYQPARWASLRRVADGSIAYSIADGWLDAAVCKIWAERRTTIHAAPVLSGDLLYGFRDCKSSEGDKGACSQGADLTLIFPQAPIVVGGGLGGEVRGQNGAFGVASIPFRRGGGASLFVRLDINSLRIFRRGMGDTPREPEQEFLNAPTVSSPGIGLGVEVVQGVNDPEPIAIAYLARDIAPVWR
jgi:hypothetical protein